jgi:cytosine/adenosine deaminase-related metal-dependent hydrolase
MDNSADLIIKRVRPHGGEEVDLLVRGGRIAAIGSNLNAPDASGIDAEGAIAFPGFVEAHTHLDKTLLGMPWHSIDTAWNIPEIIATERRLKLELGVDAERQSARQVELSIANGTTHIRSHVDVDAAVGLRSIEGVLATRERYRDAVEIEIVAFPQSGLLVHPGTLELMKDALAAGADVVGGLDPSSVDRNPCAHLDTIFALAERFGRPIDIHLHEPGELGAFSVELVVERAKALGMQGKVTLSHAFCLGMIDGNYAARLIDKLREAGVAVLSTAHAASPTAPVKRLVEVDVTVAAGSDGIRSLWGPLGNADMLERAMLLAMRNGVRQVQDIALALEICTHGGAKMMGLDDYGLAVGCKADLVLVDALNPVDAVARRPQRKLVMKSGRITARDGSLTASY